MHIIYQDTLTAVIFVENNPKLELAIETIDVHLTVTKINHIKLNKSDSPSLNLLFDCTDVCFKYDFFSELDLMIESMMRKLDTFEGGDWSCNMCDKRLKKKSHMQMHVEAFHVEGVSHKCEICFSDFKTRSSLKAHVWRLHRQTKQTHPDMGINW